MFKSHGVDPVHFGKTMIVDLGIGPITPPAGSAPFVGAAVSNLPIGIVMRAMKPFLLASLIVLGFITYMLPVQSLWLPRMLGP